MGSADSSIRMKIFPILVYYFVNSFTYISPEGFVHGCEVDHSVGIHAVLVQGPPCLVQPLVPVGPPDGVVGPVHGDI